ncbi:hypothetical protein JAAARDRAFT_27758 [Jaapia argillacea MUCL 33604]|uniref:uS12 prolyl 3,4-dihydroxylase n=1 Tax=Jaapia argillacea MUCL 33604 TaxID=933084 RepID=A0A067QNC9_9AGAM|nr:hypothetical protein JAAARDRAFT_27758 [Jaapia argillacea MUCL 33604]
MPLRHARSSSPEPSSSESTESAVKRLKTAHKPDTSMPLNPTSFPVLADPTPHFSDGVLDPTNIQRLNKSYLASEPYKYAVLEKLFQDTLLQKVKDEILSELNFTEKETDIYKVNQTGDLASLSFLTAQQIALLPSLLTLRDALYSQTFRTFLRKVTGCGPLSGIKQDMSVNTYKKGCHLLNHDDVIGSRRVSYILYMPLPNYQLWPTEWGGALELYGTKEVDGIPEPECVPVKSIPPSWNQFIFFEVQPGHSFHSVEEVVVGEGEDGRQRLSISGWFHAAQPGEEGYAPEPSNSPFKSSRDQLASTHTAFKCYPDVSYPYPEEPPLPDTPLSEQHRSFLSEFLNPVYLQHRTMKALAIRFVEESSLELHSFLCAPIASKLESGLREIDKKDGLSGEDRHGRVPLHSLGTSEGSRWVVKGPPHKWRYCSLKPSERTAVVSPRAAQTDTNEIMKSLQEELFPSPAFRAWLACVSRLLPLRYAVEARRFRPGLDYTLATSEEREARLDVVLGLTPDALEQESNAPTGDEDEMMEEPPAGWQSGEWGGWECYMAPHDEEDDPAVYRSGRRRKSSNATNGHNHAEGSLTNGVAPHIEEEERANGHDHEEEPAESEMDEEELEEEDSGTLLTVQPGFNRLLLVLRDEGVMRFVKYVSAAADGSRWDVCGEWEVGMIEEEA